MAVRPLPDVPAGSYGPEVLDPGVVYEDNWKESENTLARSSMDISSSKGGMENG